MLDSKTPDNRQAPSKRKWRYDPDAMAAIGLLCERFPQAFAHYELRRKPLKIGIFEDLLAALDGAISPAELKGALRLYCSNGVYRSRLQAGAVRFDLNGEPAGTVSPEHAMSRRVAKPKRVAAVKPVERRKPVVAAVPVAGRLSLKDLREAAQRRKTGGVS